MSTLSAPAQFHVLAKPTGAILTESERDSL
jgi:hypothetical protein